MWQHSRQSQKDFGGRMKHIITEEEGRTIDEKTKVATGNSFFNQIAILGLLSEKHGIYHVARSLGEKFVSVNAV